MSEITPTPPPISHNPPHNNSHSTIESASRFFQTIGQSISSTAKSLKNRVSPIQDQNISQETVERVEMAKKVSWGSVDQMDSFVKLFYEAAALEERFRNLENEMQALENDKQFLTDFRGIEEVPQEEPYPSSPAPLPTSSFSTRSLPAHLPTPPKTRLPPNQHKTPLTTAVEIKMLARNNQAKEIENTNSLKTIQELAEEFLGKAESLDSAELEVIKKRAQEDKNIVKDQINSRLTEIKKKLPNMDFLALGSLLELIEQVFSGEERIGEVRGLLENICYYGNLRLNEQQDKETTYNPEKIKKRAEESRRKSIESVVPVAPVRVMTGLNDGPIDQNERVEFQGNTDRRIREAVLPHQDSKSDMSALTDPALKQLKESYRACRHISANGNCYYEAVMLGYLEKNLDNQQKIDALLEKMKNFPEEGKGKGNIQLFKDFLGRQNKSIKELYDNENLRESMVWTARYLTAQELEKQGGVAKINTYMSGEEKKFKDNSADIILREGEYVSDALVTAGILESALDTNTVIMAGDNQGRINRVAAKLRQLENADSIHLALVGMHYTLLYPK